MTMHTSASALSMWDPQIVRRAIGDSFRKLHPRTMVGNPVMFVVEVGSLLTTLRFVQDVIAGRPGLGFEFQITFWLWLTVLFANFAEAMAEGRGKAQADALRRAKTETVAKRERPDGSYETVAAPTLRKGDVVRVSAGEVIPADGEIVEGVASVDESAITGESAPVIRESGGDRSAVTGGTRVLSDWIRVRVTANPGETFLDRMIALVEGAERQKTPNEIALNILLVGLTVVFLIAVVTLQPFAIYSGSPQSLFVLISLLVCLIPTTIGGLLSAIGIAGMDRLVRHNVLALSGRAVEAAGDVHTLLLDKTGTITLGNRQATEFVPIPGVSDMTLADAAQLASLPDETPEGRSIVVFAKEKYNLRGRDLSELQATFVPFTAQTRMSGVDMLVARPALTAAGGTPVCGARLGRARDPQGRRRRHREVGHFKGWRDPGRTARHRSADLPSRWHTARRGGRTSDPRRHPPEGHRQRWHPRALRASARDGDQDRDDHRRQSAHSCGDRLRSWRRRLPRAGDTGRQDGTHQTRAG